MKGQESKKPFRLKKQFSTKEKKSRKYLLLVGCGLAGPWEAFHMGLQATDDEILEHIKELQETYPDLEVRLYLCETGIKLSPSPKKKAYQRIKKLKHIVKSSAEWIRKDERTAVCNICGAVGPIVPMNEKGNSLLATLGWFKDSSEPNTVSMMRLFGGKDVPQFTLRCPECNEIEANKNTRKDWF